MTASEHVQATTYRPATDFRRGQRGSGRLAYRNVGLSLAAHLISLGHAPVFTGKKDDGKVFARFKTTPELSDAVDRYNASIDALLKL